MLLNLFRITAAFFCALGMARAEGEIWVPGLTEPFKDVVLSANVPGTVANRFVHEGDFVTNGQVMVELDKRIEELAVQRHKLISEQLQTNFYASRFIFTNSPHSSVSAEELAKAEVDYHVGVVDYETAVEQLRKRQIRAPMDGFVIDIFVQVGEDRKAQEPVLRMAETRRCYFIANVEAKAGWRLKVDQTVPLQIDTGPGPVPVEGRVVFVSPVVDPASGLMRVRVLFSNPDGKIRPGVAGKMKLEGVADGN